MPYVDGSCLGLHVYVDRQDSHGSGDARTVTWPDEEVEAFVRRRRILWVMLACLLAPVALYALLPLAAAAGLTYFLHRQGYHHVTVQLGYPGWHTLQVPVLSLQKDVDGESLSVTVQD